MPHPVPDRIDEAADRIERACSHARNPVMNLLQPYVSADDCRTTACFAGWWQIARVAGDLNEVIAADRLALNYEDGADDFARFIGLADAAALEAWAAACPHLWGNACGRLMFSSLAAYDLSPYTDAADGRPSTIDAVLAHWRAVAGRIRNTNGHTRLP